MLKQHQVVLERDPRAWNGVARDLISMKPTVIGMVAAVTVFCGSTVRAGNVQIGFVNQAELDQWLAGGLAEAVSHEGVCKPAKFNETSDCPTVVISNHSSAPVEVKFSSTGEAFSTGSLGAAADFGYTSQVPRPCDTISVRGHLEPGERCYQSVSFWPRTGEIQHGEIRVIVKAGNQSSSTYLKIRGTSDYPPELQAAEEVRQRHQAELMKIPHVASVELDDRDGIKINVTVKDDGELNAVRRLVPPRIEGYETEVTPYVIHGYGL